MLVIKVLFATASFPFLNAIMVDSYYTPSQNKEQIHPFQPIKTYRPEDYTPAQNKEQINPFQPIKTYRPEDYTSAQNKEQINPFQPIKTYRPEDYTPAQNKEQINPFQPIKTYRPEDYPVQENYQDNEVTEHYTKPLYKYGYSVLDPYTLDVKSHWEHRDGDFVKGAYNMLEADGSMRIVEYVADKNTGFRAVVKKIPHYLKKEKQLEPFPSIPKSNNHPQQFLSIQKSLSPPAPQYQNVFDKPHPQNSYDGFVRSFEDQSINDNYYKQYQKKVKKQPVNKYRHVITRRP